MVLVVFVVTSGAGSVVIVIVVVFVFFGVMYSMGVQPYKASMLTKGRVSETGTGIWIWLAQKAAEQGRVARSATITAIPLATANNFVPDSTGGQHVS